MSNETRNEIKSYIALSGWKLVDIIEKLNMNIPEELSSIAEFINVKVK